MHLHIYLSVALVGKDLQKKQHRKIRWNISLSNNIAVNKKLDKFITQYLRQYISVVVCESNRPPPLQLGD